MNSNNEKWEFVSKKSKQTKNNNSKQNNKISANGETGNADHVPNTFGLKESDSVFHRLLDAERQKEERKKQQQQQQQNQQKQAKVSNDTKSGKDAVKKSKKKKPEVNNEAKRTPSSNEVDAINKINYDDLVKTMDGIRNSFPTTPLIWLKDLVSYLNDVMYYQPNDSLFAKPLNYPITLMPKKVLTYIESIFKQCALPTLKLFQEFCFDCIVQNILRQNFSLFGYIILIQCLAKFNPAVTIENSTFIVNLRTSYQNRTFLCNLIVYSALQAGLTDLSIGLKLWHELNLPIITMKSYSKFSIDTLNKLLNHNPNVKSLNKHWSFIEFFPIFDLIFTPDVLTGNLQAELKKVYPRLKALAFGDKTQENMRNFFPSFLRRLDKQASKALNDELLTNLTFCLINDDECLRLWQQMFSDHLIQSNILLKHLKENFADVSRKLPQKLLNETLINFITYTEVDVNIGKQKLFLTETKEICQVLLRAMSKNSYSWLSMFTLFILLISCLLAVDWQLHGSFENSRTGRFIKESGLQPPLDNAVNQVLTYYNTSAVYLQKNVPIYYTRIRKVSKPYVDQTLEYIKFGSNYVWEKALPVRNYVNKNGPILWDKIKRDYLPALIEIAQKVFNAVNEYSKIVISVIIQYFNEISQWLVTNVFVGSLAPENLKIALLNSLEATQFYFNQAVEWISKQVSSMIK